MTPTETENTKMQGGRVLVLEPDAQLATEIVSALGEAAPASQVDLAHSLEEAQNLVLGERRPDLFVLDVDATQHLGQEFLYDLRTSHPNARAIVLTAVHLAAYREKAAGLGAIHFLEKPFPHRDFVDLVQALLAPAGTAESEKFQGTLSDLHIADIIQLKCMSGATSGLEFTGPHGEKARVFFENGQVRHATAPGKEGVAAFNEIVEWKGGKISEVSGVQPLRTIALDWQILLLEAVRKIDETGAQAASSLAPAVAGGEPKARKVLVIDDSVMLLSFVNEILTEARYQVVTASTAEEGLRAGASESPDLILLDYLLPDMKGDEVIRRLAENSATANIPIVYMSGFGSDLQPDQASNVNVIGSLNKPFTSELLITTVENYMPKQGGEPETNALETEQPDEVSAAPAEFETPPQAMSEVSSEPAPAETAETASIEAAAGAAETPWWSAPAASPPWPEPAPGIASGGEEIQAQASEYSAPEARTFAAPIVEGGTFFSGDTSFFSLNWALQAIARQKLTGTLRCSWSKAPVELLAQAGQVVLVTSRDPALYCPEAPITLVNVDAGRTAEARAHQGETGAPLFITLAREELILREPAIQLVQHYGQKLFGQLWSAPLVRFVFEQSDQLPDFARDVPAEEDLDHWALATLRFLQFQDMGEQTNFDPASIPAYTRDGFERIQRLRLTVAEAQFASQFNGVRSIAQIAKNLRLDLKFARLTLFRFLALEIVECWPATAAARPAKRGMFGRLGKSIGLGE